MSSAFYQTYDGSEQPLAVGTTPAVDREPSVSIRTGGAVVYQSGETTSLNSYSSLNLADTDTSGGLHAGTPTGSPRQGALRPTDIIQIAGTETTVANAEALGLIERDIHGRHVLVPDGASRALANEPTQEEPQDDAQALSNPAVEADLASLCSSIPGTSQVAVLQQLVTNGEILPGTLNRAASESGIEPTVLSERINTVVESFTHPAESMLRSMGADDPSAFWEWAQENHKAELQKAMSDHAMLRTTSGYTPLYQAYVETLADHSADDVLNAQFGGGITARMEGKQVILNIPGHGSMPFRSAIKAELIKVSGV
jgi:hypothetical protein